MVPDEHYRQTTHQNIIIEKVGFIIIYMVNLNIISKALKQGQVLSYSKFKEIVRLFKAKFLLFLTFILPPTPCLYAKPNLTTTLHQQNIFFFCTISNWLKFLYTVIPWKSYLRKIKPKFCIDYAYRDQRSWGIRQLVKKMEKNP